MESRPETRGYHLRLRPGLTLESIHEQIDWAGRAGFNLIIFPIYINGYTTFPCEAARSIKFRPIHPGFGEVDLLDEALAAASERGLAVWGFARPYNFHPRHALSPHKLLRKHPQWRMASHPDHRASPLRRREEYAACPINPDYRRYLGDLLSEVALGYPIGGIILNLAGYGLRQGSMERSPFCFCPACRKRFAEDTEADLLDMAKTEDGVRAIREWQTAASTAALDYLRHRIGKNRKTLRLFCRAQPQWRWRSEDAGPELYERYCLDWPRLLGSGTVHGLVIDHDEELDPQFFGSRLVTDLSELHDEAILLPSVKIVRASDVAPLLDAIRRYPVTGFLAEFDILPSRFQAEKIREEFLTGNAEIAEESPLESVASLCLGLQIRHSDNGLLHDLMRDFFRLIFRAQQEGASFHRLEVMYENLAGLQDAIRRNRLGGYEVGERTLRDISLARRLVRLACLDVHS